VPASPTLDFRSSSLLHVEIVVANSPFSMPTPIQRRKYGIPPVDAYTPRFLPALMYNSCFFYSSSPFAAFVVFPPLREPLLRHESLDIVIFPSKIVGCRYLTNFSLPFPELFVVTVTPPPLFHLSANFYFSFIPSLFLTHVSLNSIYYRVVALCIFSLSKAIPSYAGASCLFSKPSHEHPPVPIAIRYGFFRETPGTPGFGAQPWSVSMTLLFLLPICCDVEGIRLFFGLLVTWKDAVLFSFYPPCYAGLVISMAIVVFSPLVSLTVRARVWWCLIVSVFD